MLGQIKQFFELQPIANLHQVAERLQVEPEVARCMLQHWILKGQLRCLSESVSSGSCGKGQCVQCQLGCTASLAPELYAWA